MHSALSLNLQEVELLTKVQDALICRQTPIPGWRNSTPAARQMLVDAVRGILMERKFPAAQQILTAERLADAIAGIGVLDALLREPGVEEIYVRGNCIAVRRDGGYEMLGPTADEDYFIQLVRRVSENTGVAISDKNPTLLVDLPGGERFTALLPPLATAPSINIRTFGRRIRSMRDLAASGTFALHERNVSGCLDDIRDLNLRKKVAGQPRGVPQFLGWSTATLSASTLFCGQFSAGKTTLFNAISEFFPPAAPIAVLETFRELQLAPGTFELRAIAPSAVLPGETPRITMGEVLNLVFTRCDPAAILLGEIVSPSEAMRFLEATNLGRRAYSTIHGASVLSALHRLEQLALAEGVGLSLQAVRALVASGLDLVVLMDQAPARGEENAIARFVAEVVWIRGLTEDGDYDLRMLYSGARGESEDLFAAAWQHTGAVAK
jgi:type IV secretory pathway ATPase VirB11/archaellum biosynthesis ATPase